MRLLTTAWKALGGRSQPHRVAPGTRAGRKARLALAASALTLALALAGPAAASLAPDPGGDESAQLSGPPPGKLFGFAGVRQVGDISSALASRLVARTGGNATRTAMHWQALEPTRDHYRRAAFARYDHLYAALRSRGIKPVFVLQFAPAWARDHGPPQQCGSSDACHYPPAPGMLGEWREFVRDVARRYPRAALEVWNEPNYLGQWQSGVDPARYARLLAVADAAAASVHPRMPVLMGGLASVAKTGWWGPADFLRSAYAATPSLAGRTDAINFHVYPTSALGAGSEFARLFAAIRSARAAAGDTGTPLLVSELGLSTTGPHAVDGAQQSDVILRATRRILTMSDTLGVFVYTLVDREELAPADPERGFGVIRATAGRTGINVFPKPAYCALRREAGASSSRSTSV